MSHLGVNLSKLVENLCGSYKMLLKQIKEGLHKWRHIPIQGFEDNKANMSVVPKLVYKFKTIPTKILAKVFIDIDSIFLKCIWQDKRFRLVKTILGRKEHSRKLVY